MRSRVHTASRWIVALSLVAMGLFGFASNQLLDEDAFAGLISSSIDSAEVRELLADKAVDIAIDASDADVLLADALPDDLALIATPALELSKPAIAEAGATLLGIDTVGDGLEAAARSVHRQTSAAIVSDEDTDVVINALPLIVVVADEIAGDVGARAAVGLDLPDGVTSINLGSNQSPLWAVVQGLGVIAGVAALVWLLAMIAFFATAPTGGRVLAARRLGRTFAVAGGAVMVIAWLLMIVAAAFITIALSPGDALSFGSFSVGGADADGAFALAEILFEPLLGSARRTVINGLLIIVASYIFGRGSVARSLRQSIRHRDVSPLVNEIRSSLPNHVTSTKYGICVVLAVLLVGWPQITTRVAITLVLLAVGVFFVLTASTSSRSPWPQTRDLLRLEHVVPLDATERTAQAQTRRRWLFAAAAVLALLWPNYDRSGLTNLVLVVALLFALLYRWERGHVDPEVVVDEADLDEGWSWWRKGALGLAIVGGVVAIGFGGDNVSPASATSLSVGQPTSCNGLPELCDRRLDEAVFAGTHNSMSSSDLGWELANHKGAIPDQLDVGIRALLIDVQYWPQGESVDELALDPSAAAIVAAALDVTTVPEDGLWMCHQLCQLGGTPFTDFLADLRVFLETHPDEVLIVVIQDDAPADDIKAAIELSEVDEYAYAHVPGETWPTLGAMIDAGERVVFLAENDADASGWYQQAFEGNVIETDYSYAVVEDFECAANRGGDDGGLFMINHWVETGLPVPSEADTVNSRAVLLERVDECVAARGRGPGIIAVNFWERGDLLAVVDELNLAAS